MSRPVHLHKRRRFSSLWLFFATLFLLVLFLLHTRKYGLVWPFRAALEVERVFAQNDQNGNGIDDYQDLVDGAREQMALKPVYKSVYYAGGYPLETEGVCTDLLWRAFRNAGYDLKTSVDMDIAEAASQYPRVGNTPDPNIDFRRVPNLVCFLTRTQEVLTTSLIPWDADNVALWQPGDIVVFGDNFDHVGLVSDKRRRDGVPLVIHHPCGHPVENSALTSVKCSISGHFRLRPGSLAAWPDG